MKTINNSNISWRRGCNRPHRNIWKHRDWIMNAFYEDKSCNEFTIEQLAGDLLPDPTQNEFIATVFYRISPQHFG